MTNTTLRRADMQLERTGPEPLFSQIEARLSYEIVTGKRASGSRLPSLREAATAFGVNLHTVRRAYNELEAKGLVTTGAGGTRVASLGPHPDSGASLDARIRQFAREVRDRFGVGPGALARAFESIEKTAAAAIPSCAVVECSRCLSVELAKELETLFVVTARPLDLLTVDNLPVQTIVGTYFHAEELRSRMEGRLQDLHFVRIRPRVTLMASFARAAGAREIQRVVILDRLPNSAHDLAGEFRSFLGPDVTTETRVLVDPLDAFPGTAQGSVIVATPQTWDRLTEVLKARRDVFRLEYEIEPQDLERLPEALGWKHRPDRTS